MIITPKLLAEGQVSSSKSTLYTVPALTETMVKYFSIMNTSVTPQSLTVYVNVSGTSRVIAVASLLQNESLRVIEKEETLSLDSGDKIEAQTTTAGVVDFIISGAEQS